MNENTITLKTNQFPKMMREFAEQNFNLKMLLGILLGINLVGLVLVLFLVKRGPVVVALDNTGEVARLEAKVTDLQIVAAAKEYLKYRYSWNSDTISDSLGKAKFFVLPSLAKAFEHSMVDVQKFVREKKVTQRVYAKSVAVDLKEKKITVFADRITEFDQLKAATEMKLTLTFTVDDRTVVNPWGIYITKESEEAGR